MYTIFEGTDNPTDNEVRIREDSSFHHQMNWLVLKANEYVIENVIWLHQPELNALITLRIRTANGHRYYRLYAE